jgi:5'-3' exoribonuclease 2
MGVPALFRWLSRKYPKIISPVVEDDLDEEIGGAKYSDPNPNGEVDNLYLDMNGIVHPCSHPEHKSPPETEDEMFLDIFTYTDRVLMMARPRKVLMIAVDGVAPRAKMNQQRARRFRSAQDAKIKDDETARELRERENRGELIDDAIKAKKSWDSNAITPGTPFMDGLALALRYWVAYKLANDPGWADLQVIISDATVPGEGEHKLMNFIRSQRLDPQYNPNTKHCIYGLDADLIFLGLATHEPHFRVLREDVFANQSKQISVSQQLLMTAEQQEAISKQDKKKPFLWLHVNVLREYLEIELHNPHLPFPYDLERAIDDWVFMCFFVGNDFLPHLPSLDVRDNGIDILVNVWKRLLPQLNDYITCDGKLNLLGVEKLMASLSYKEADIFKKRHDNEVRREEGNKRRKLALQEEKELKNAYMNQVTKGKDKAPIVADVNMPLMTTSGETVEGYAQLTNKDIVNNRDTITMANMANSDAAAALKKLIDLKKNGIETPVSDSSNGPETPVSEESSKAPKPEKSNKREFTVEATVEAEAQEAEGDVRLWEPGYRNRYYETKFECGNSEEINQTRKSVVRSYLEGISWVLGYYFQGCPSWQWYYPYHYAPFAADFTDFTEIVGEEGIKFDQGQPFRPYEQLMSVLPAASGHSLPQVFRDLMSNPNSDIIDFYPEDFKIDMNGKKMSWQGIALLPFIDEKRLLSAVQGKYELLTEVEMDRNTNKQEVLFISPHNKNYNKFHDQLYDKSISQVPFKFAKSSLAGTAMKNPRYDPSQDLRFPLKEGDMPNVSKSEFFQVTYNMPAKKLGKSMLLNGYISHNKVLTREDAIAMQQQGFQRNNYRGNRFQAAPDNSEYVNTGPRGKDIGLIYSLRRGGYGSFVDLLVNKTQPQAQGNNYGSGQYNNSYENSGGYNNYNNGGYNNYNSNNYGNNNYGGGNNNYGGGNNNYGGNNNNNYGGNSNNYGGSNYNGGNNYNGGDNYGGGNNYSGNNYNNNQGGNNYGGNNYGGNNYGGNNYNQNNSYNNSQGNSNYNQGNNSYNQRGSYQQNRNSRSGNFSNRGGNNNYR